MEPFKNVYSAELVACLAGHIAKRVSCFDRRAFCDPIREQLENLELKQRAQLIADQLHAALPADHGERARVLLAMLHPDEGNSADRPSDGDGIRGWGILPLTMVVGQHGVEDFERSLDLLKEMTKRFSSEFGVRYFLLADLARSLGIMRGWTGDPNRHVRRLVSEGTRPRLPWAMHLPQLIDDPSPMLPILETLRDDDEEYVRRSVANHLNDIARDHPDLIAGLAIEWADGAGENRRKLVRHACRTLIKQGHPAALEAIGLAAPQVELRQLSVETAEVNYGEALVFAADLHSSGKSEQPLAIDYLIHFRKANGKLAAKVFKGSRITLKPGEIRTIKRTHPIRPITTRRYYAGEHGLSLRINGRDYGYAAFNLLMPENTVRETGSG